MNNLSYHLSDKILSNIKSIDLTRTKILITPLNPKSEISLRWNANIEKTYWGLTLADNPLSKRQMIKILGRPLPKRLKDNEKEVITYLNTLYYIKENWTASNSPLLPKDILHIYDLSCKSIFGSTASYYNSKEETVSKILEFIEKGNDHPVIKAGLIQIELTKLSPFENGTGRVARLVSHLMLSRFGYDLRGLLVLEDYYRNDLVSLKEATNSIVKYKNATKWLEYFTEGIKSGMEKVLSNIAGFHPASSFKLNERQNKILEYLENPNLKITNRDACKMFAISQITASRDLSKMVNLGILLPHGKGRSVYYTK